MNTILLTDFDEVAEALKNPDLVQSLYDAGAVVMADVLLTLHGDSHRARRNLEMKVFRRDFFRHYEQNVFPATLEPTLAPHLAAGHCDLVQFGYDVTLNLTADFAGIDRPSRSTAETQALLALVKTFSTGATLVHSTRDHEEVNAEVLQALDRFDVQFLQPSMARRQVLIDQAARGEVTADELPRDVLTTLMLNEDKLSLPRDVLRREIAFYLQAGSHSTANSVVHACHELFSWGRTHPDDWTRFQREPLFLQRAVHESLRLHPASPVAWRRSQCPQRLSGGQAAAIGDCIVLDLGIANRAPGIFGSDSERFNPHRLIPRGRPPFGLTFGIGVHTCLGRDLDGGVLPKANTDADTHQYGLVTLIVRRLTESGARPVASDPPTPDSNTARNNWGRYPVTFRGGPP